MAQGGYKSWPCVRDFSQEGAGQRGRLTNKSTAILCATVTAQGGYKSSGVIQ